MTESVLVTYEEKVVQSGSPMLDGASRAQRRSYTYRNGSVLVVGGLDKSSRIMSTEYDMIAVFEATEVFLGEYEDLLTRLRNGMMPYHQIITDCNPGAPTHWLNLRAREEKMARILSRHQDNPRLFDMQRRRWTPEGERYRATLSRLSGARRARLLDGAWAAQEGMVYGTWDDAVHIVDRFDIPKDWPRYRVIDFGYTNALVCQWWAEDPDGRLYRYREIYHTQRRVSEHARQINALSAGERILFTVCDHDAEDRATLEAEGIPTIPADKRIRTGIEAVQARLEAAGDGRPRLFFLRDSLVERDESLLAARKPFCTEQEIDGYVWPKGRDGKELKEVPVKADDHGMDAMRYLVMFKDGVSEKQFAWY